MRVFVHVHYGTVDVYQAEDEEDRKFIYNKILNILQDFGEDCDDTVIRPNEKHIMDLIYEFGGFDVHESFEFGTGFTTVIER